MLLLGKEEIVRFLFVFAGKETKLETITHEEFIGLLNHLHPFDKKRAKRALKELNMIPGKLMKFDEMRKLNDEFPAMFYPAFKLQHSMRVKTMGEDWWVDKLRKYRAVRRKMASAGNNIDVLAEVEMKRFKEDEEKRKRMQARDVEIRNEASTVRKAILNARQFMDEFS